MRAPDAQRWPHPALTILILALAPAVGLGIGRFAYSLVLPDMRDSLGWSYSSAGFMNTVNAAGYLAGALVAARLSARFGLFALIQAGTLACVLSLALCGLTADFTLLSFARLVTGLGAALAFVAGGALSAIIAQTRPARASFLLSLFYAGPGAGIALSGLISPFTLAAFGPGSWWIVWLLLAGLSAVIMLPLVKAPAGSASGPMARPAAGLFSPGSIAVYLAGYFCFGVGYIAYMTFMIAYVRDGGGGPVAQATFWCLVGLSAFASPWLWSRLIARARAGGATAVLLAINAFGAALPLFGHDMWLLAISALVFGSAFFAVVNSTTAFARTNYPPEAWPTAIAAMTIVFGIGQTFGPIIMGAITDALGSLTWALVLSAATLALGAVAALLQRPLRTKDSDV